MMKYITCPDCGAHLDHGESCDCKKKAPKPASSNGAKEKNSFSYTITIKEEVQGGRKI